MPSQKKGKDRKRTPVMEQFFRCKAQYPEPILFFRLGDFYEMFHDDAVIASELLDITLTSRSKTAEGEKIPMAGVPHHAAAGYIARLLEKGRSVALCEQMADPSTVKGVVPREVVRVITPGLCVEPDALDAREDNYLAVVHSEPGEAHIGMAVFELSTAELRACELDGPASLLAELVRLDPREILVSSDAEELRDTLRRALPGSLVGSLSPQPGSVDDVLARALGEHEAQRAAQEISPLGLGAAASALRCAQMSQPGRDMRVQRLATYDTTSQLVLDEAAVRNLELVRTLTGERKGSLLSLVDQTRSPMGARTLRRRLLAPLTDVATIRRRHDLVEAFVLDAELRKRAREALARIGDIERLATRAELGLAGPRDLGGIRDGLGATHDLSGVLEAGSASSMDNVLKPAAAEDRCNDIFDMLDTALVEEPPAVASAGTIVREHIHPELDELRQLSASSKNVILELEQRERKRTGIGSLKIRYTRVFGYYIEVTKSNLSAVPEDYHRKQTVANAERYVTEELEELQARILNADDRARSLELEVFLDLRARVAEQAPRLRALASQVGDLDVHTSFAEIAHRHDYSRPEIDNTLSLVLEDARHPVVERLAAAGEFVPNDVLLDAEGERLMMITGPNMAGKSTAMRQVALCVILAQAGGFVPAKRARIGVVDRIYTRVGASDNLGQGQSTFMVEMRETASILRGASKRSLVILDEIGRGTSTYDGLAIAWAVAEHLADHLGCRAMFATHYHELCELAEDRDAVVNYNVAAKEYGSDVVFLHKLVPGSANRSYGIAVARLAGVPEIVLARARSILGDLEDGTTPAGIPSGLSRTDVAARPQLDLFVPAHAVKARSEVEETLRHLDVDQIRPVEALVTLARLKELLD